MKTGYVNFHIFNSVLLLIFLRRLKSPVQLQHQLGCFRFSFYELGLEESYFDSPCLSQFLLKRMIHAGIKPAIDFDQM